MNCKLRERRGPVLRTAISSAPAVGSKTVLNEQIHKYKNILNRWNISCAIKNGWLLEDEQVFIHLVWEVLYHINTSKGFVGPNIFAKLFSNVKEYIQWTCSVLSPACSVSPLFSDFMASCLPSCPDIKFVLVLLPLVLASPSPLHPHQDPSFTGLKPFLVQEVSSAGRRELWLPCEHRPFCYPTYFVSLVEPFP